MERRHPTFDRCQIGAARAFSRCASTFHSQSSRRARSHATSRHISLLSPISVAQLAARRDTAPEWNIGSIRACIARNHIAKQQLDTAASSLESYHIPWLEAEMSTSDIEKGPGKGPQSSELRWEHPLDALKTIETVGVPEARFVRILLNVS